ncbi:MAG: ATP-binding protein [Oligoflexia bacterium]|nr:ATP-binding protein [Oligoflexia bacterium]
MKRRILKLLHEWRESPTRTPIMIRGARQTGKTWVCREFGKGFTTFIEINLEVQTQLHRVFDQHFGDPEKLIKQLAFELKTTIVKGETLLFLDEIQECESAIKSLRYFKEKLPELHVISTGSLLEFKLKRLGVPVGRVSFCWLFPMNFEEFLWAHHVESAYDKELSVDAIFQEHLAHYLMIGGLPEVVDTWIKTENLFECQNVLQRLAGTYRTDFNRYGSDKEIRVLQTIFDKIPRYWGQKTKYSLLSENHRAVEVKNAIDLLRDAGLVSPCYKVSGNGLPLRAEANFDHFKLFSLDLGLGQRLLNLDLKNYSWSDYIHIGGLMEQFIAGEIRSYTSLNFESEIFYWQREQKGAKAELDFIINRGTEIVPVEVKAGKNRHHPSLSKFIEEKKSSCAIHLSALDNFDFPFSKEKIIHFIPFWRFFQTL